MNPLSSIRQLWSGGISGLSGGPEQVASPAASIPATELRALNAGNPLAGPGAVQSADTSFSGLLGQMVQDVNAKQHIAGQALRDLQSGQNVSLHQAMISMEEASVSFQLMVEVRNKLLESYQELMRMQV
jgi:flagellar hook-basal body complex protein FliE